MGAEAPALTRTAQLAGPAYQARPVEVIYFWATWCAPCKRSTQALTTLASQRSSELSVRAVSSEERDTLNAYLREHARGTPLSYLQLLPPRSEAQLGDEPPPHPYASEAEFVPYVFLIHKGRLVWKGNPTYPKGAFMKVIEALLARGEAPEIDQAWEAKRAALKAATDERARLLNELKEAQERALKVSEGLLGDERADFWLFDQRFWALHDLTLLERMSGEKQASERALTRYHSSLKSLVEGYTTHIKARLTTRRDDLVYVVADLYGVSDEELQAFELAEPLLELLSAEGERGLSYPDYYHQLLAERALRRGELSEARAELTRALELATALKRPARFMEGLLELEKRLKPREGAQR